MGSFTSKTAATKQAVPVVDRAQLQAQVSDIDRAILDLKNARDKLQRYRNKLQLDGDKLVEQAKHAKTNGRTSTALGLLRLRKYKLQQASSCDEQLLTVLQMVQTIDSKQNEQQLLQALAAGKDALKKMHEETTVDDVLNLMDEIQDELAVEQEIRDIIQQQVPELSPADELAVEQELEQLQAELASSTPTIERIPDLPQVPTTKLPEIVPTPTRTTTTTGAAVASSSKQPERVAIPG